MKMINNKIDFALIMAVQNANPNGDPLSHNTPRQDYDGHGEMSDVCLKRKIRNRLQDMGENILYKSNERTDDGFRSLKARIEANSSLMEIIQKGDIEQAIQTSCAEWIDVRAFGAVVALTKKADLASFGVRGAVTIQMARSLEYINIRDIQITKSLNTTDNTAKKDKGTMGMKYQIIKGAYITYGSIFPQLAEKTGLTKADAEKIKYALQTLFENDASAARPSGTMVVGNLFWWEHNSKIGQYPSIKVHRSLKISPQEDFPYYSVEIDSLKGLEPEIYQGY